MKNLIASIVFVLIFCFVQDAYSQQIVLSNKRGIVGRVAQRITGDYYTHSAIVLNGYVYESDWPRVKKTPVWAYGKRGSTNDYYNLNLSQQQINQMQAYAESRIGEPYRLRNYFRPGSRPTYGTWCSPFVGQVLNSGGYNLSRQQMFEPQNLYNTLRPRFSRRQYR